MTLWVSFFRPAHWPVIKDYIESGNRIIFRGYISPYSVVTENYRYSLNLLTLSEPPLVEPRGRADILFLEKTRFNFISFCNFLYFNCQYADSESSLNDETVIFLFLSIFLA